MLTNIHIEFRNGQELWLNREMLEEYDNYYFDEYVKEFELEQYLNYEISKVYEFHAESDGSCQITNSVLLYPRNRMDIDTVIEALYINGFEIEAIRNIAILMDESGESSGYIMDAIYYDNINVISDSGDNNELYNYGEMLLENLEEYQPLLDLKDNWLLKDALTIDYEQIARTELAEREDVYHCRYNGEWSYVQFL